MQPYSRFNPNPSQQQPYTPPRGMQQQQSSQYMDPMGWIYILLALAIFLGAWGVIVAYVFHAQQPSSTSIEAVDYVPVFTFTDHALDLNDIQNLTANYIDFGNYVQVRIQYSAFANGSTTSDLSFDFSLPTDLDADTTGTGVGIHIVQTDPDLITEAPNTTLIGQGSVALLDSMTATATGANSNPSFVGPTEAMDLYTGSVFFEYFKA